MADYTLTIANMTVETRIEAVAYPRMDTLGRLTVAMHIKHFGVGQYQNFNFASYCNFNGYMLAADENGIVALDQSDDDGGFPIDAFIELPLTDFGVPNQKRLRKAYLDYETTGELTLTVTADDGTARTYTVEAINTGNAEHSGQAKVGRDGKGRSWALRIDNVDGCDFSIDSMDMVVMALGKCPKGWGG